MLPNYYNPYMNAYPSVGYAFNPYNNSMSYSQVPQMITVDGETGAKSWQFSGMPQPNMIIPLFDIDGEHVYFRSYDAQGRMNPMRKGKIVFDEEPVKQEVSVQPIDLSGFVTKEEFEDLLKEIKELKAKQKNQNCTSNRFGEYK